MRTIEHLSCLCDSCRAHIKRKEGLEEDDMRSGAGMDVGEENPEESEGAVHCVLRDVQPF